MLVAFCPHCRAKTRCYRRRVNKSQLPPDATTSEPKLAAQITDKKGYAARWLFSPRTIDNLLKGGLPHCKIGARRVRISIPEADDWMRQKFGTQRRAPARPSTTSGKSERREAA